MNDTLDKLVDENVKPTIDTLSRFSEKLHGDLMASAEKFTTDWLYIYGVPGNPLHLRKFAESATQTVLADLVQRSLVDLTATGEADEAAQEAARQGYDRLTEALKSRYSFGGAPEAARLDERVVSAVTAAGGYL